MARPTKYKKEFCERLIKHMAEGLSYKSFAAEIGVSRDSLFEWEDKHPEFSDSKKRAREALELFYEKLGRSAIAGKIPGFNGTAFVWMTKNMLGWRDKSDVRLSGAKGGPVLFQELTEAEIDSKINDELRDFENLED